MSSDFWKELKVSVGKNQELKVIALDFKRLKNDAHVCRLGLSAPFFQQGWGDLGVVSFEEAESLLRCWPPEHFDTKVGAFEHCSPHGLSGAVGQPPRKSCKCRARHRREGHREGPACVCRWSGKEAREAQSMARLMKF